MSDLKILDPKSILFVGGKGFNIPKGIRDPITTPQWEQDDDRCSAPSPAPDLVVLLTQWASHEKINRGREYATALNIPCLDAAGSKSDMVKRAENLGLDITGIFEKKAKPEQPHKAHKCKRIEGSLKAFILNKAAELKFGYPLRSVDAGQIQELVTLEMDIHVEIPQIQRALRIAYTHGQYPPGESVREVVAPPAIESLSPPITPASALPTEPIARPEFSITGSVEAIFKKLFDMHDKILSLIDERNMYAEEVGKLTAENKLLKDKTERLAKIESALKTIT